MASAVKRCPDCGTDKPVSDFYVRSGTGRPFAYCKPCHNRRTKASQRRCKPWLRVGRAAKLKARYGLALDDFDALMAVQRGRCAICAQPFDHRPPADGWHVDHDHATGRVRGLLCAKCNQGLGSFRDNPERLRAAADYLDARR
jgi:hypothetical protein